MIRDATSADAESIARIYTHYIIETAITFETEALTADVMWARIDDVQNAGKPWLVATAGDLVLGYAYASTYRDRAAYDRTLEATVYVHPNERGHGVGVKLYEELIERLRAFGTHAVIGTIALPNAASTALHEKLGFTQVSHMREVGYKFGKWVDVGHWQMILDEPTEAHDAPTDAAPTSDA